MNRQRLLRLYPRHWRARYGDEFLALLEQQAITPAVVLDVLRGALDAHLRPYVAPVGETPGERGLRRLMALRATALTVFCAYVAFIVAGLALFGMVDDSPFIPAMRDHAALNACWLIIQGGAAVALPAAVVGGLPIGLATLANAVAHRRWDILRLLGVPLVALCADGATVALVTALFFGWLPAPFPIGDTAAGEAPQIGNTLITAVGALVFVAGAVASAAAVATAVSRSEPGAQRVRALGVRAVVQPYQFALLPATTVSVAMIVMLAGTISWGLVAHHVAPHAFTASTLFAWLAIVGTMALATLVAAAGVMRGYAVHREKT